VSLAVTLRLFASILLVTVIQVAVADGVVLDGAHPELLVEGAAVIGLLAGSERGAIIAFFLGLVADLFLPTPFGLSALVFTLVAFVAGLARQPSGESPAISTAVLAGGLGVFGGTLGYALVGSLLGQPMLTAQLLRVLGVTTLAAVVLAVPLTYLFGWALAGMSPGRAAFGLEGGTR
jgi:rod shape-determining protein MreD